MLLHEKIKVFGGAYAECPCEEQTIFSDVSVQSHRAGFEMEVTVSRRRSGKLLGLLLHGSSSHSTGSLDVGETKGLLLCNIVKEGK